MFFPRYAVILLTSMVLLTAGLLPARTTVLAQSALGPQGTNSDWSLPGSGYYNIDTPIVPLNDPQPAPGQVPQAYFYSSYFEFTEESAGWIGIQTDQDGKRAIFSIWDADQASCSDVPGAICEPFDEGSGVGFKTTIPYSWVVGHNYRVRVWANGTDAAGEWWLGAILDDTLGTEAIIGSIHVPSGRGWLSGDVYTDVQWYGPLVTDCNQLPLSEVVFGPPRADAGTIEAGSPVNGYGSGGCASSITSDDGQRVRYRNGWWVAPPPTIMAGDFSGFWNLDDPEPVRKRLPRGTTLGNKGNCTAGFAVIKNSTRYMLTTNHCRAWTAVNEARKTSDIIGYSNLVKVVGPGPSMPYRPVYAHSIDCLGPKEANGMGTDACLRPQNGSNPDDILAWRPDDGALQPTGQLRVTHQLPTIDGIPGYAAIYPVLGAADWKHDQEVCRMGQTTRVEKCGRIGRFNSKYKAVWMEDNGGGHANEGDSGGPVYAYKLGPDGKRLLGPGGMPVGVWAIGITLGYEGSRTYFMPIRTVESLLGVEVLVGE